MNDLENRIKRLIAESSNERDEAFVQRVAQGMQTGERKRTLALVMLTLMALGLTAASLFGLAMLQPLWVEGVTSRSLPSAMLAMMLALIAPSVLALFFTVFASPLMRAR